MKLLTKEVDMSDQLLNALKNQHTVSDTLKFLDTLTPRKEIFAGRTYHIPGHEEEGSLTLEQIFDHVTSLQKDMTIEERSPALLRKVLYLNEKGDKPLFENKKTAAKINNIALEIAQINQGQITITSEEKIYFKNKIEGILARSKNPADELQKLLKDYNYDERLVLAFNKLKYEIGLDKTAETWEKLADVLKNDAKPHFADKIKLDDTAWIQVNEQTMNDPELLRRKGNVHKLRGQDERAQACFDRASELTKKE